MTTRSIRRSTRWAAFAVAGCLAGIGAGAVAHAEDPPPPDTVAPEPVPEPAPAPPIVLETSSFTLPLFGAPLTIDVSTGPGGNLTSVMVNPADGFTATKDKPNKVAFVNEDGTAKVVVSSKHGGQRIEVKAGTLAEISGDTGGWSGDVFGDGTITNVTFAIGDKGDGTPDITGLTVSDATAEIGTVEYGTHGDDAVAKVAIRFSNGTQSRWLSIKAVSDTNGERTYATVRVSLSKLRNIPQEGDAALGAHQWTGVLCDGTEASIDYDVAADGTITLGTIVPATDNVKVEGNHAWIRFASGEKVGIKVFDRDGTLTLTSGDKIRCRNAADPEVNVPVVTTDDDHGDHDHDGHHGDKDWGKDWGKDAGKGWGDKGRGDKDHDDESTTTTVSNG